MSLKILITCEAWAQKQVLGIFCTIQVLWRTDAHLHIHGTQVGPYEESTKDPRFPDMFTEDRRPWGLQRLKVQQLEVLKDTS